MKLTVHNLKGEEVRTIDADDLVFGLTPHQAVMRQALLAQLANRRAGSANTKTRGEVRGSTRKIRRQKGIGAARQGSIRAPHHRHGGIVLRPQAAFVHAGPAEARAPPGDSLRHLPRKVEDGELKVVDAFDLDAPRTKAVIEAAGGVRDGTFGA